MKILLSVSLLFMLSTSKKAIDFGTKGNSSDWYVLNDAVMGGLSEGNLTKKANSIIFEGSVSLENNGGFASIRSAYDRYKMASFNQIEIRYRSNAYDFAMTLELFQQFYRPYFKYNLPDTKNEWVIRTIDLKDFKAYSLGKYLGYKLDNKDKNNIIRMGFISDEKRAGAYMIEIDYINFIQ